MTNPFRAQDIIASRGRGGGAATASIGLPPLPPHFGNLAHWWDFNGLDSIYQDAPGTVPISADGQNILRMDNKGYAGSFLDGTGFNNLWRAGPFGPFDLGYLEVDNSPVITGIQNLSYPFGFETTIAATGITYAVIARQYNNGNGSNVKVAGIAGNHVPLLRNWTGSTRFWSTVVLSTPVGNSGGLYGLNPPLGQVHGMYQSVFPNPSVQPTIRYQSPGPDTIGSPGGATSLIAPAATNAADVRGDAGNLDVIDLFEMLVWDTGFINLPDRVMISDWITAKYGSLPA